MAIKYEALRKVEQFDQKFHDRPASSDSLDRHALVDVDIVGRDNQPRHYTAKWIWLIHAMLLLFSSTLFAGSYYTRLSTLRHVKQFSAYCKCPDIQNFPAESVVDLKTAPAASSIEYEHVKFNLSMNNGSPFVGYGPEVDAAWNRISYDSRQDSHPRQIHFS